MLSPQYFHNNFSTNFRSTNITFHLAFHFRIYFENITSIKYKGNLQFIHL